MLQRLDRDTSGLMVFSIHPRAHKKMTEQFSTHTIVKKYIAIVAGRLSPEEGEIRSMLARNRATNLMKSVEKGGQEAITRYRAISLTESASIVDVELLTGRSHQIRAHFSEAGHPLLGDVRYNGPEKLGNRIIARQMLHANKLSFLHPVKGGRISFELALPEDMHDITQLFV
jgi:23S rRNA pseudouridine1911/1915/1917 synthase